MATRREELNALMEEMRAEENAAVAEMHDLFMSEDMGALLTKLGELRDRTIPGSSYDQILSSTMNVINSTRMMAQQAATSNAAPDPAATLPASQQVVNQPAG